MERQLLHTLIAAWSNRLDREIGILSELLPADMPRRENQRLYVGPRNIIGGHTPDDEAKPRNWLESPGVPLCLDGLYALRAELETAIETLDGEKREG